jgi:hypothetical protein
VQWDDGLRNWRLLAANRGSDPFMTSFLVSDPLRLSSPPSSGGILCAFNRKTADLHFASSHSKSGRNR